MTTYTHFINSNIDNPINCWGHAYYGYHGDFIKDDYNKRSTRHTIANLCEYIKYLHNQIKTLERGGR